MTISIKRALISVSDKSGVIELATALQQLGIEILSTGGTAKLLTQAGLNVIEVGDYTGFPEMLDGRVKTLHPRIHGGILFRRDLPEHAAAVDGAGIPPIDLVVVNLYPFSATIAKPECTLAEAIENIDIGGPTLIRAAAKNYGGVAIITDPADYTELTHALQTGNGALTREQRFGLAVKAFSHTAAYDGAISNYLSAPPSAEKDRHTFPGQLNLHFTKVQELRYGENPHQQGAFYREPEPAMGTLGHYTQQQGKSLSYNNIADSDAAWECVKTFDRPACVIVKHANPCGAAIAENNLAAYRQALATDPSSAFGGIIAFNRPLEADTAEAVMQQFLEVLIAPAISAAAAQVLAKKPNIRILTIPLTPGGNVFDYKRVGGGLLVQTPDKHHVETGELRIVSQATPTPQQRHDLLFAWRIAKFVKSNAIVFAANGQTLGVGAGQMSRVDSARIAAIKAHNAHLDLHGAAVASDAFFPFRDGVDVVAEAGATAIIQPGGSIRDEEVIAAANERGITMVFTGIRHFRH